MSHPQSLSLPLSRNIPPPSSSTKQVPLHSKSSSSRTGHPHDNNNNNTNILLDPYFDSHTLFHQRNKLLHALILSHQSLFKLKQKNGMLYPQEKWLELNATSFMSQRQIDELCDYVLEKSGNDWNRMLKRQSKSLLPRSIILDEEGNGEIMREAQIRFGEEGAESSLTPVTTGEAASKDAQMREKPCSSNERDASSLLPEIKQDNPQNSTLHECLPHSLSSPSATPPQFSPSQHPQFLYNQQQEMRHHYDLVETDTDQHNEEDDTHTDTSSVATESEESWLVVEESDLKTPTPETPVDPASTFKQVDKRLKTVIQSTSDRRQSNAGLLDRFSFNLKTLASKYWYGTSEHPTQRKWSDWISKQYDMRPDGLRISKVLVVRSYKSAEDILVKIRHKPEIFKEFNATIDNFLEYLIKTYRVNDKQWVDVHLATKDVFYFSCAFASLLMIEINQLESDAEEFVYKMIRDCIQAFIMVETYEYFAELFYHTDSNALISKRILELRDVVSVHSLEICPEMCLHKTAQHKVFEMAVSHLKQIEYTLDVYEQLDILYQSFCFCWSEFDEYYTNYNPQEFQKDIVVQSNEVTKLLCYLFLKSGIEILPCIISLVCDLVDRNSITENHKFLIDASRVALNWTLSLSRKPEAIAASASQQSSTRDPPGSQAEERQPPVPPKRPSPGSPGDTLSPLPKPLLPLNRSLSSSSLKNKPLPALPPKPSASPLSPRLQPPPVDRSSSFSDLKRMFEVFAKTK